MGSGLISPDRACSTKPTSRSTGASGCRSMNCGRSAGSPAGHLIAHVDAEGLFNHARVRAQIDGVDIAAGPALFNRVRLDAALADLAQPEVAVTGEFHGGGIDGTLALNADLDDRAELAIR